MRTPRGPLRPLIEVEMEETLGGRRALVEDTPFGFLLTRFEDGAEVDDEEFVSAGRARTAANSWLRSRSDKRALPHT